MDAGRNGEKAVLKRLDLIKGICFLIFSLIVCYESTHLSLWSGKKPGPGLFPLFLGIALALLSLVFIFVKGFRQRKEAIASEANPGNKKRILLALGILISYAIVLPFLGFVISSFFLIFFLFSLSYPGKWIVSGTASVLVSLTFYVIFQILLKIQLPRGILGI